MELSYIINELGEERENYYNAIAPPIMQTSNFSFRKVAEMRAVFENEMSDYIYTRGINPTVDILRKKLAALDGAEDCLVFNCGAAAIFAGVLANVKAGDHIVSIRNPYTWAQKMFEIILPRFGVTTTFIDGREIKNFEEALLPHTTLIYLESPNSWNYELQDLKEVATLARSRNIITLIDNSYCTALFQRPVEMGIDISIQTATKYISGHSDTLGGVLSGTRQMIKKIFNSEYLTIGSGMQPFNAWLLIRGLRTLPARIERLTLNIKEVVRFLKGHPAVEEVLFPLDPAFPQYELATKQMKGACGLLTFSLKNGTVDSITRFCESLGHIMMAVSWGGHESLVLPKCAGMDPGDFDPENKEHQYIRLYVGLEEPGYIIGDLEQALNKQ